MRRPATIQFSLILLAGAACGFACAQTFETPFPGARPQPEDFVEPLFPHISDADAAIYRRLNENISVEFGDVPLDDAMSHISRISGIPIIMDVDSIEEAGLLIDKPVNLKVSNIPVHSILKLLLEELEMTIFVEDGVLKVTTSDVCNCILTTGIFPVSDLVTDDKDSWKTLSKIIEHDTDGLWERMDGTGGTISISRATKSLVIRQTPRALTEIQNILTFLRAAKRVSESRVTPSAKQEQDGEFGLGGKKGRRRKGGLGGSFGGNFF